jgi:hypothetical protein
MCCALLHNVGLFRVMPTRRVRAIDERYYGRVGRTFPIARADAI